MSYIGARRMRVTKLDRCGRVDKSTNGAYAVSSGFVSVEIAPEVEEGDDYTTKNAGGDLCISDKGQDNVKWMTVSIEFCQVDPALFTLMNPTWKTIEDAQGMTTGFRIGQALSDQDGFALELWPKVSGGAGCEDDGGGNEDPNYPEDPNGYFLLPYVLGTAPDSWTLENGAATFTLTGRTKAPSQWGVGPWAVTRDENGDPAPLLVPIENGSGNSGLVTPSGVADPDHFHADRVTVAPPRPSCGAQPLRMPAFNRSAQADRVVSLTITNWDDIKDPAENNPRPVVVYWGDGEYTEVDSSGDGTVADHTYPEADTTYTIKVLSFDGAVTEKDVTTEGAASENRTASSLVAA